MLNSILKRFLGTKSEKDIKGLSTVAEETKQAYQVISQLSNDQLRAKTIEFKEKIAAAIAGEEAEITSIKQRIDTEDDLDIEEKEKLYNSIDQLEKVMYQKTQDTLLEILPEAFAVIKETARRFKEN
jgi:preprotein translocase subunit SecA